ncbi:MAG: M48 family metalloprotease [Planctomycetaceae bacterium]
MPITVQCQACGAGFAVKDELAGKRIRCVKCKEAIQLPSGYAGAPAVISSTEKSAKANPAQLAETSSSQPATVPAPTVRRARRLTVGGTQQEANQEAAVPTIRARATRSPRDVQADSIRHTAATLSAPPEDFQTLRRKVFASFTSPAIVPVPVAASYRLGIALTSLFMIMLPLIYLAMIFGVGWLAWYHAVNHISIVTAVPKSVSGRNSGHAAILALLLYLTPIIAGVVLILFMLKPLFSKPTTDSGRRTLKPGEEPLLFEFVDRICAAVGAPRPRRIDIDCNINASAGFGRGLLSMLGNDLVLTIGMPLVAGLTMRQFAGVLAHEFGHFSQGAGMRLSYLIRSVSLWFMRVVYERDSWDDRLEEWSKNMDLRIGWVLHLTRLCVWLSRKILWVLMMTGHLVSGYLLRQMEFDADRHEARLAGSRTFASTARQLAVLNVAHRGAISDLSNFYVEGRLGDNLPKLILLNADQLPEKIHAKIEQMILESKTGLLDTHPADAERLVSAAKEDTDGIFHLRLPAAHLFRRFDFLSRAVTWDFYKELFGKDLRKSDIHPVDDLMDRLKIQQSAWKALRRFFQDHVSWYRPLPAAHEAWKTASDIPATLQHLKHYRTKMLQFADSYGKAWKNYDDADTRLIEIGLAEALLQAGIRVRAKDFSVPLTSTTQVNEQRRSAELTQARAEKRLIPFEYAAADRLYTGLMLARHPELAPVLKKAGFLVAELDQLLELFQLVNERLGQLLTIRDAQIMLGKLLTHLSGHNDNQQLVTHIRQDMRELYEQIEHLRSCFEGLAYPFDHARADISVADFLLKELPDAENPVSLYEAADEIGHALPPLQARIIGRLCQIVECVETHYGLPMLEDPPEPDVDLKDEDDDND